MKIRKSILSFLFIVLCVFSFGENIKVETVKSLITGKLENGMTYYIYQNKRPSNRVSVNVLVKAGSLQEDEDQKGMAHFIEHLCFNGTEKYSKNEVVKYYQSIGLNFGGDLNAHTSFDETVYKIQIPTDDKAVFEKGIEVLKEMTLKPTFNQEDIDNEKNIIKEEWRLSQGLNERITKVLQEELFYDSRYGKRFPIGDMKIIENTKRDVLKRYYDRWYHPENMAVVIVGDIEPHYAESIIKKYFDYKETRKFVPREEYRIKDFNDSYRIFRDKELTSVIFEMSNREDYEISDKTERLKYKYENLLFKLLLQNRMEDEIKSGNNFIYEGSFGNTELSKDRINSYYVMLNKNTIAEGITKAMEIIKDMAENGVSEEEFEIEKENIRSALYDEYKNKDRIKNEDLIPVIRRVFLNNDIFLDSTYILKYYFDLSKEITKEDMKNIAERFYNSKKTVLLFAPSDEKINVPDSKSLEKIINTVKENKLFKKEEKNISLVLDKPNLQKGNIKEEQKNKDYTKITLSNGIEFLYKKTDFEKDKIYIKLYKREGSINDSDMMYLNSKFATSIVDTSGAGNIEYKDINRFMKGKEFSVETYINSFEQGIVIESNERDLTVALDYFSHMIREPKISFDAFKYKMTHVIEALENKVNSPDAMFFDTISEVFFNNDIRKRMMEIPELTMVSTTNIKEEFKDKFSDFTGFKGVVVGSLSEEKVKSILEEYFASLPVKNKEIKKDTEKEGFLDIKYPKGEVEKEIVKGVDKKATISLYYPINIKYSKENKYIADMFGEILKIELIDEVREKLSGVYGVHLSVNLSQNENGYLHINFSTDPKRRNEVIKAVRKEVNKLVDGNIKDSSLESIIKNYKIVYENRQKENAYWINYLNTKLNKGMDYEPYTPEEYREKMKKENLVPIFKNFVDKNNCVRIILIPEREE